MSNKEQRRDFSDVEYRFSFSLTISDTDTNNDTIIVKRDFNVYNLDEESLCSIELKECIDDVVDLIDRDLKSKSRVYMWYNYDENYDNPEFSTPIPETTKTTFKFTLFDNNRPLITKIWSGDEYPFSVRNSVDLTNKKYKYNNIKSYELDFAKQVLQKASADKSDLTSVIIRHISSTCASYQPKGSRKKLMYKQYIPDLMLESIVIDLNNGFKSLRGRLGSMKMVTDDNGFEKEVYEVYTTKYEGYDLYNKR